MGQPRPTPEALYTHANGCAGSGVGRVEERGGGKCARLPRAPQLHRGRAARVPRRRERAFCDGLEALQRQARESQMRRCAHTPWRRERVCFAARCGRRMVAFLRADACGACDGHAAAAAGGWLSMFLLVVQHVLAGGSAGSAVVYASMHVCTCCHASAQPPTGTFASLLAGSRLQLRELFRWLWK